jgi:nucleotide-binding universal stress UspA family protein
MLASALVALRVPVATPRRCLQGKGADPLVTTILLPVGELALAERALPFATTLARTTGARLVLVRAASAQPLPGMDPRAAGLAASQRAEAELGVIVERLRQEGLTADATVYAGEAGEAIVGAVRQWQADFVVMATHGRTGMARWIGGSVADSVLRRTSVPVLLVPAACKRGWPVDSGLRIVVPLDGSWLAEQALVQARAVAGTGGEILLYRALLPYAAIDSGETLDTLWTDLLADVRSEAVHYLEGVATMLRADGYRVRTAVEHGAPVPRIAEYARREQVDLIVLSSHGRAGAARWLLGSVAEDLLREAPAPLLLVRPLDGAGQQPVPRHMPNVATAEGTASPRGGGASAARAQPRWRDAPDVDRGTVEPGYLVFAHQPDSACHVDRGQFVGVVADVFERGGVHYLHVRGDLERANDLFLPIGTIQGVMSKQIHLKLSLEDLAGQAWHQVPGAPRPA